MPAPLVPPRSRTTSSSSLPTKTIRRVLYRRTKTPPQKSVNYNSTVWFAYKKGYGSAETYGPFVSKWRPTRPLKLLDIGKESTREELARLLNPEWTEDEIRRAVHGGGSFSCDEQYSGGSANRKFHAMIRPLVVDLLHLHGTVIVDGRADEECRGPSEVVLYVPRRAKLVRYAGVVHE